MCLVYVSFELRKGVYCNVHTLESVVGCYYHKKIPLRFGYSIKGASIRQEWRRLFVDASCEQQHLIDEFTHSELNYSAS